MLVFQVIKLFCGVSCFCSHRFNAVVFDVGPYIAALDCAVHFMAERGSVAALLMSCYFIYRDSDTER